MPPAQENRFLPTQEVLQRPLTRRLFVGGSAAVGLGVFAGCVSRTTEREPREIPDPIRVEFSGENVAHEAFPGVRVWGRT